MDRGLISGDSYSYMDIVYRGTTLPKTKCNKAKKMLLLGGTACKKLEPIIKQDLSFMPQSLQERLDEEEKTFRDEMSSMNAEEVALLDMDDIELRNIQLQMANPRRFQQHPIEELRVRTDRGEVVVGVVGDRAKPAILTYNDLGLNHICLQPFFNYPEMRALLESFCVYHVNALGQEEGAPNLPEGFTYPTMDELANQINYVLAYFGVTSFIGFGVGAGAYILARFAVNNPNKVDALALINCTSGTSGWLEWGCQKLNSRSMRNRGMTQGVLDYLMWHHFGRCYETRNYDLTQVYRAYFARNVNPYNLSLFTEAYINRPDLAISREGDSLRPPVLNITGALSPHVDDTVHFNGRLKPHNSTWMKVSDCAMPLEEQPGKVAEAFRLFLQGEGYAAPQSPPTCALRVDPRRRRRHCRLSPVMRITENPLPEAVAC